MHILCDTCSVLMLLRVAPEMFNDDRFKCVTTIEVKQEIIQSQKFKDKYPWRQKLKAKIKTLSGYLTTEYKNEYDLVIEAINSLLDSGLVNNKTGRSIAVSRVDKSIAAHAICRNYKITTDDKNLAALVTQEFDIENISPLGLINKWLENGLIHWNNEHQTILEDWDKCREAPQPKSEIKRFKKITGYKYPGP